jgi:hypothetical protein
MYWMKVQTMLDMRVLMAQATALIFECGLGLGFFRA